MIPSFKILNTIDGYGSPGLFPVNDKKKQAEIVEFFKKLDLYCDGFIIPANSLFDMLNDPEKRKIFLSKLNNKAFW